MRSTRSFLWVERMLASPNISDTLGRFLRYLHYRDHIQEGKEGQGVAGLVRYVAYRDQASPEGRLFTRNRAIGEYERQRLVSFVRRSLVDVPDRLLDRGRGRFRPSAAYRFVVSPEDARGLDLRRLTREIMGQLESDAGDIPPWIAAEHRNTAHAHIHILMAARREIAPGVFSGVVVNRRRLSRMGARMRREIEVQRGDRPQVLAPRAEMPGISRVAETHRTRAGSPAAELPRRRGELARHDPFRWRSRRPRPHEPRGLSWYPIQNAFVRLAAHYRKELQREEELMQRRGLSARDAGEEREWEVYE